MDKRSQGIGVRVAVVALYAIAMGYLEAVVVYYIRYALGDIHATGSVSSALVRSFPWGLEATREVATLVMLATVAILAGRDWWERAAALLWAFGIWDATYYAGLEILTQWPPSLTTQDVYFLLPVPWGGPVWVPLACDVGMAVLAGLLVGGVRRRRLVRYET
ncbi:MAG TPA: hypothetical protein VET65_01110 [Candidatus Limnocylindrales bacterium]|nr:hypothetical protein [Candidatus Limnocylindrales bacterium]